MSTEALWGGDAESPSSAALWFRVDGGERLPSAETPSIAAGREVVLSVLPAKSDAAALPTPDRHVVKVDLLEACPPNKDCRLEYEVRVEWVAPESDVEIRADLSVSTSIGWLEASATPAGAEVTLEIQEAGATDAEQ